MLITKLSKHNGNINTVAVYSPANHRHSIGVKYAYVSVSVLTFFSL